jgi:hypothetical protein
MSRCAICGRIDDHCEICHQAARALWTYYDPEVVPQIGVLDDYEPEPIEALS